MTYRELFEKMAQLGKLDETVIVKLSLYGEYYDKLQIGEVQVEVGEFKPAIVV
jgi:hypothetical protein